jgi:polyhydroxyalkanoate synthesis regulator protein
VKYILFAIFLYIAYQLIFKLVIPVYQTTKEVKKKFSEMQNRMQEHMNQQQADNPGVQNIKVPNDKMGDYIEFEEVK